MLHLFHAGNADYHKNDFQDISKQDPQSGVKILTFMETLLYVLACIGKGYL